MNTKKTETEEKYYEIMDGPSKDMLFDACRYAYNRAANLTVNFSVAIGYTMPRKHPNCCYIAMPITHVRIVGIEYEDGSGERFNLHGYCMADLNSFVKRDVDYKPYRFKAYYNSKKREGRITFIEY
jgi:hypothetical protein